MTTANDGRDRVSAGSLAKAASEHGKQSGASDGLDAEACHVVSVEVPDKLRLQEVLLRGIQSMSRFRTETGAFERRSEAGLPDDARPRRRDDASPRSPRSMSRPASRRIASCPHLDTGASSRPWSSGRTHVSLVSPIHGQAHLGRVSPCLTREPEVERSDRSSSQRSTQTPPTRRSRRQGYADKSPLRSLYLSPVSGEDQCPSQQAGSPRNRGPSCLIGNTASTPSKTAKRRCISRRDRST